jgi:hypothetical protein
VLGLELLEERGILELEPGGRLVDRGASLERQLDGFGDLPIGALVEIPEGAGAVVAGELVAAADGRREALG